MQAVLVPQYGEPEVLEAGEVEDPAPKGRDLLVDVHASAMNPIDFKIRRGALGDARQPPFPLGFDVSGVVRQAGPDAAGFSEGDAVWASPALIRPGAHAERVLVDARTAAPKPSSLSHEEAAGLPLVTLTAWEALHERARLQAGETVLVQGGAGGVGHVAIQLAKQAGARVLATAGRDASKQLCARLGAEKVLDYNERDPAQAARDETGGQGPPVVLDCVGGAVFENSADAVAPEGRLATIVGAQGEEALKGLFLKSATLHFEMMGAPVIHGTDPARQGRILREAARFAEQGALKPHIGQRFSLLDAEQAREAHRQQETHHTVGKMVYVR
jgi:NADPH2:quinone reductase